VCVCVCVCVCGTGHPLVRNELSFKSHKQQSKAIHRNSTSERLNTEAIYR